MKNQLLVPCSAVLLLVLAPAVGALAGEATDNLRPQMDQVIATIENPALRTSSMAATRRETLRTITDRIFDWTAMAQLALGRHWQERTATEQQEFVNLFRDLMERAYLAKIERYGAEPIAYLGESPDGDATTVRTRVTLRPGQEVGVDYRMARQGGRWMIHDVVVQAISLVSNYRTQFESILRTSSYQALVEKIRSRLS